MIHIVCWFWSPKLMHMPLLFFPSPRLGASAGNARSLAQPTLHWRSQIGTVAWTVAKDPKRSNLRSRPQGFNPLPHTSSATFAPACCHEVHDESATSDHQNHCTLSVQHYPAIHPQAPSTHHPSPVKSSLPTTHHSSAPSPSIIMRISVSILYITKRPRIIEKQLKATPLIITYHHHDHPCHSAS